jgi:hypothetical protein
VSASNGWLSRQASQPAFDTLDFELMARPEAANLNGLVAIGGQDLDEFSDAAILVRFASDGVMDARDGAVYDRDIVFPYEPGTWYSIAVQVDITTGTYDVEVGRCGEPRQTLIAGASFRANATIKDQLTTWGGWSSKSAKLELATPAWVASGSCAAATCQSLGHECGQASDGCGDNLSCGSCGGDEACVSGICVDTSTPPPSVVPPSNFGDFPTRATTGITDYWCPRWDTLKSGATGTVSITGVDQEIDYLHVTGDTGQVVFKANGGVARCVFVESKMTSNHNGFRLIMNRGQGNYYGGLVEDTRISAGTGGSSDGLMWASFNDANTAKRFQIYTTSIDSNEGTAGLIVDSYIDLLDNEYGGGGDPHADAFQLAGGCGPHWFVHNSILGSADFGDDGFVTSGILYMARWANTICPDQRSYVVQNNYLYGGIATSRWSDQAVNPYPTPNTRFIDNVFGHQSWRNEACDHNRVDRYSPNNCFEYDNNWTDADIPLEQVEGECKQSTAVGRGQCEGVLGIDGGIQPIPVTTISNFQLSGASCTQGQTACNNITLSANVTTNEGPRAQGTGYGRLFSSSSPGGSFRWRYSCGGSSTNILSPDPSTKSYQDGGADLWYDYDACDGLSNCTITAACDYQAEGAGTYTAKIYAEAGPGAAFRPSDHKELTFTVR